MNDSALLREYALKGSETAFETLVRRHLDMVYSAAFRQTGDAGVAEEVAQAAFILLARKAAGLNESVLVPGWLYRTACFLARKSVENRTRRHAVEKEASEMSLNDSNDEVWSRMTPQIDAALSELGEADRNALLLRFLQQRSLREVAEALGTTEDAARKRVARALEKVRALISRRGVVVALTAMSAALAANSVEAAPSELPGSTLKAAIGPAPAAGSAIGVLVGQAAREILFSLLKKVAGLAATAGLLISGAVWWSERSPTASNDRSRDGAQAVVPSSPQRSLQVMAAAKPARKNTLVLRVVAMETGAPLSKCVVFGAFRAPRGVNSATQPDSRISFSLDPSGAARIPLAEGRFKGMQFWVTAPGRVPLLAAWKRDEELSLPSEYTVRLERGTRIGGTIVDENGLAVAGASISFPAAPAVSKDWDAREIVSYDTPATTPRTDAEGRWLADFISPDADRMVNLGLTVSHPSFVDQSMLLRDLWTGGMTNALVMRRGCLVTGSLSRPDGNPVPGAYIWLAQEGGAGDPARYARTVPQLNPLTTGLELVKASGRSDASGRFQLPRVLDGQYKLRAALDGLDPTNFSFLARGTGTNFVMTMTPSPATVDSVRESVLRGRVTDEEGRPLPGAKVVRQPQVLAGSEPRQRRWSALTDEQGRFEWSNAPAGSVRLMIQGNAEEGDWEDQSVELAPDGTEPVITLKAKTKFDLRLTVTDHETGEPVPFFKVASAMSTGSDPGRSHALSGLQFLGEGRNGKFALRLPEGEGLPSPFSSAFTSRYHFAGSPKVVVRATGYLDKEAPLLKQTNDLDLAVSLDRSAPVSGRVLTPAGQAAAGAAVLLINGRPQLSFARSGRLGPATQPGWAEASTGADGVFHCQAAGSAGLVAATHDSGWAISRASAAAGNVIQLRPWSRIEGTVRVGRHDWAGVDVYASLLPRSDDHPGVEIALKTDTTGRFEFPKLPDGRIQISFGLRLRAGEGLPTRSHPQEVTVAPGETATVSIGGSGATVSGRAVLPPEAASVAWTQSKGGLYVAGDGNSIGYPFAFRDDGSFVIEDVPPGKYALQLHLSPSRINPGERPEEFGGSHQPVVISQSFAKGGELDLGVVQVGRSGR